MATQQNLMDKGPWLLGLRRDTLELGKAALTAVPVPDGDLVAGAAGCTSRKTTIDSFTNISKHMDLK